VSASTGELPAAGLMNGTEPAEATLGDAVGVDDPETPGLAVALDSIPAPAKGIASSDCAVRELRPNLACGVGSVWLALSDA
jgi:hypothetical protein